ncbi:MAG: MaoC/PaaZ C-terminal domain-containing protein [Candidatus Promineifilaceae bacterium]|nr:MaoC/PaaZ C-terminal domain-containing protein [Candidatus Promineifilaceae bacterium]
MDGKEQNNTKPGNKFVNLDKALGFQFQPTEYRYAEHEASLYALSIGAARNAVDETELQFVYAQNRSGFRVLPTFAVTFPFGALEQIVTVPGLKFNFMNLLYGEQYLEIKRPLAATGIITNHAHISQIYDKGSGALVIVDITSTNENGDEVAFNQASIFLRGIGDFGGDRGPSSKINIPPNREPDALFEDKTRHNQALLYRLSSGDNNPLHADPGFAAMVGFERPILHGLCTFGFAGRAILKQFASNDSGRFKSIKARFSHHVFPGETILTEMWQEQKGKIIFRSKVKERDEIVLSNGAVEISEAD